MKVLTDQMQRALWVLANHADKDAHQAACLLLCNFLDQDITWWALVDALRDADEMVRGAAMFSLHAALKTKARRVEWAPVAGSLAHLLDGTNITALLCAANVVVATEVAQAPHRQRCSCP